MTLDIILFLPFTNVKGGKEGEEWPKISSLFKRTRQDRSGNVTQEVADKYVSDVHMFSKLHSS